MALARIISRSAECSRQLALDLLAHGYAVEIVSPDAIPDNIADLELRVDNDPGNQLVASVAAHDGEHSASLEFVHHLRAPMVDFVRRPPEPPEMVYLSTQAFDFNAEAPVDDIKLPADTSQPAPEVVFRGAETPLHPDTEEGARLISPATQMPSPQLPTYFAVEETMAAPSPNARRTILWPSIAWPRIAWRRSIRLKLTPQWRAGFAGWHWRAALTFASVVALAMVVGFGVKRTGKDAAQVSELVSAEKVEAAATDASSTGAAASNKISAPATSTAMIANGNSAKVAQEGRGAKPATATTSGSTAGANAKTSHKHDSDLIARDTVTYLDQRFAPHHSNVRTPKAKASKPLARRHPKGRRHKDGVIAANRVTYLESDPKVVKK
jgi:hypothetical protein